MNEGKKNGQWKGGRIISSGGYVMLRTIGHPRATKKGHYVFEHILVMERYIGRYLKYPNEEIHHRNNNKQDNRLSNLKIDNHSKHLKGNHKPKHSWKKGFKLSEDAKLRISKAKKE